MSHPECTSRHVCQRPSGRVCIEQGCEREAGTLWGPYWCPDCDEQRLDRLAMQLTHLASQEVQP